MSISYGVRINILQIQKYLQVLEKIINVPVISNVRTPLFHFSWSFSHEIASKWVYIPKSRGDNLKFSSVPNFDLHRRLLKIETIQIGSEIQMQKILKSLSTSFCSDERELSEDNEFLVNLDDVL